MPAPLGQERLRRWLKLCANWEGSSVAELAVEHAVELGVGALSLHREKGGKKGEVLAKRL